MDDGLFPWFSISRVSFCNCPPALEGKQPWLKIQISSLVLLAGMQTWGYFANMTDANARLLEAACYIMCQIEGCHVEAF